MIYDIYNLYTELGTKLGFLVVPYSFKQFKKEFDENKAGMAGNGNKKRRFLNELREEELFGLYEHHIKTKQHTLSRQYEIAWNKNGDIIQLVYHDKDGKPYLDKMLGCKEYHVCHGKANTKLLST